MGVKRLRLEANSFATSALLMMDTRKPEPSGQDTHIDHIDLYHPYILEYIRC